METIKSYTDLEQSKKLAEILPLESADMYYMKTSCNSYTIGVLQRMERDMLLNQAEYYRMFPCWSLAALLEQLPYEVCYDDSNSLYLRINKEDNVYQLVYISYGDDFDNIETDVHENFVDACMNMIIKLKKLNLLLLCTKKN